MHNALKFSIVFLLYVTVKTKHDSTDIIIVYGDVEKGFVGNSWLYYNTYQQYSKI